MPNAWDVGSAKHLEKMGFSAIATTSSGHARSIGKVDQEVTLDELLAHSVELISAVSIPLNVDSERLFSNDLAGVTRVASLVAETGAGGYSIEDYDPVTDSIDPIGLATERVAAAKAGGGDMTLTARAEALLYGSSDLDDVIKRLNSYAEAGADALYAPGLCTQADISRVIDEVDLPINVLLWPGGPSVAELASLGVRRVSTGGALANAAYDTLDEIVSYTPTQVG